MLSAAMLTAFSQEQITLNVSNPGTLGGQLGGMMYTVQNLKLTGMLNGDDIRTIRIMGGYRAPDIEDPDEAPRKAPSAYKLSQLDLSEAKIVKGGGTYYEDQINKKYYGTKDNEISDYMFYQLPNIVSLTLPNEIETIGRYGVLDCANLVKVTVGPNVKSINYGAFKNCKKLVQVNFPDALESIGEEAFWNCESLKELKFGQNLKTIDKRAFCCNTSLTDVTCGPSLVSTGEKVFGLCSSLRNVDLSQTQLKGIEKETFYECENLQEVKLPNTLEYIGYQAFYYAGMPHITLPESLKSIGNCAFWGAKRLVDIVVPNSVTEMGLYAFNACSSLESFTFGTGMTEIPKSCFSICNNLREITITDNIVKIGENAFQECTNLKKVNFSPNTTTIGRWAFASSGLEEIVLPNTITEVGDNAFSFAPNLRKVTLSSGMTQLNRGLFEKSPVLEEVIIPEGIKKICFVAIQYNPLLNNLVLPSTIEEVASWCCSNSVGSDVKPYSEMTCLAVEPPVCEKEKGRPFEFFQLHTVLYVPAQSIEAYRNSPYFEGFMEIKPLEESGVKDIEKTDAAEPTVEGLYSLDGRRLEKMTRGINIVKMSDGSVRKVMSAN